MGGGFGMPDSDPMQQRDRSLGRLLRREGRVRVPAAVLAGGARPCPGAPGPRGAGRRSTRPYPRVAVRVPAGGRASCHALAAKPARGYRMRSGWAARIVGSDVSRRHHAAPDYLARDGILGPTALTPENYPSQAQVWQFYQTQNPGFDPNGTSSTDGPGSSNDQGMDVQTGLEYLRATGGPDGVKAVAFAKVDHTNLDEVKAALAIFGALWLGVQVLDANQKEFSEGRAWTDVAGSAIDGGHAILGGGYTRADIKFITWAKETEFARSFWNGVVQGAPLVEEAWVVIWPEHLATTTFEQGVDQALLAADYQALTGTQLVLSQ